ncbi:hypothetical protein D9757_005604 [Collybiopsis confluens]|uniref:Impact N-terminal domain-containing protein n=1 Tax=Collybiopsis confluens TaxID=2823264 RepID=A0A8H5HT97_9AGAR|nr:hypothetical protein D9757_005604 [Collybiopsis confluens]
MGEEPVGRPRTKGFSAVGPKSLILITDWNAGTFTVGGRLYLPSTDVVGNVVADGSRVFANDQTWPAKLSARAQCRGWTKANIRMSQKARRKRRKRKGGRWQHMAAVFYIHIPHSASSARVPCDFVDKYPADLYRSFVSRSGIPPELPFMFPPPARLFQRWRTFSSSIPVYASERIHDRKSTFVAHASVLPSAEQLPMFLTVLTASPKLKKATHSQAVVGQHDGGESGSGSHLARLLDRTKCENTVVVVSRWYGGVHLGGGRWRRITEVAKEALAKGGFLDQNNGGNTANESQSPKKKPRKRK